MGNILAKENIFFQNTSFFFKIKFFSSTFKIQFFYKIPRAMPCTSAGFPYLIVIPVTCFIKFSMWTNNFLQYVVSNLYVFVIARHFRTFTPPFLLTVLPLNSESRNFLLAINLPWNIMLCASGICNSLQKKRFCAISGAQANMQIARNNLFA